MANQRAHHLHAVSTSSMWPYDWRWQDLKSQTWVTSVLEKSRWHRPYLPWDSYALFTSFRKCWIRVVGLLKIQLISISLDVSTSKSLPIGVEDLFHNNFSTPWPFPYSPWFPSNLFPCQNTGDPWPAKCTKTYSQLEAKEEDEEIFDDDDHLGWN